ncbi:hypothetical protein BJF79_30970 [Actinomadura sp. CNU-125]|uniref:hypothetical protein n=1 Tax=Actinomadura sp. CNU-125 TaxID=1904961 RepID=UPI00095D922C|nr:hypothetical protein [Actinomadura sp. CNU-125]OLT36710.1 hypothetical protein BJF79_30970 [Actinomadura sp. CNU-125]
MKRSITVPMAVLGIVLAAGGCGVRPTGITPAGNTPRAGAQAERITLYLVKDGGLTAVTRPGLPGRPFLGIAQLAVRPTASEWRRGLRTEVPGPLDGGPGPSIVDPGVSVHTYVMISMKPPERSLSRTATAQIVCTAAAVPGYHGAAIQEVQGEGATMHGCDEFADLIG